MINFTTVTIHQPNFLPWEGFFAKMLASDIMILLDHVQFSKNNYTNRTKIRTQQGWKWLTIPIPRNRGQKPICKICLKPDNRWKEDHENMILGQYGGAPYFDEEIIDDIYGPTVDKLVDFNISGIKRIKKLGEIDTELISSSKLNVSESLSKSELLLEVVNRVGGTKYISGPDGVNYIDTNLFVDCGIDVEFFKFKQTEYHQSFAGFEPGLTALDRYFNTGSILGGV